MQVGRWGNSLAVRLPASIVDALDLHEGDEIRIGLAGDRAFTIARDRSLDEGKDQAIAKLIALNWTLPPGFHFDRDEANVR